MSGGAGINMEKAHEAATLSISPPHCVGGSLERDHVPFSRRCHVTGLSTFPRYASQGNTVGRKKIRDIGVYAIDSTSPLYVSPGNTVFVMQQCVCDWTLYFFRGMHHFK